MLMFMSSELSAETLVLFLSLTSLFSSTCCLLLRFVCCGRRCLFIIPVSRELLVFPRRRRGWGPVGAACSRSGGFAASSGDVHISNASWHKERKTLYSYAPMQRTNEIQGGFRRGVHVLRTEARFAPAKPGGQRGERGHGLWGFTSRHFSWADPQQMWAGSPPSHQ